MINHFSESAALIHNIALEGLPLSYETRVEAECRLESCVIKLEAVIEHCGIFTAKNIMGLSQAFSNFIVNGEINSVNFLTNGKSKNLVLKVDMNNSKSYILKLIPVDSYKDMLAEVIALIKNQSLKSMSTSTAKLIGLAKCRYNNRDYYMVGQNYLIGLPISTLITDLTSVENFSIQRREYLTKACNAFSTFGRILSNFHSEDFKNQPLTRSTRFYEFLEKDFELFLNKIKVIRNTGIDIQRLDGYIQYQLANISELNIDVGYMFLDPHFGNVLYEQIENSYQLSLIDTSTCFYSYNKESFGCGMPGLDLYLITELYLELSQTKNLFLAGKILSKNEVYSIKYSFIDAYKCQRAFEINYEQAAFYELVQIAWYMNWFIHQNFFGKSILNISKLSEKKRWLSVHFYLNKLRQRLDNIKV